jgi:hypothetical protein
LGGVSSTQHVPLVAVTSRKYSTGNADALASRQGFDYDWATLSVLVKEGFDEEGLSQWC